MPDFSDPTTYDDVLDHVGPGKLIRSGVLVWILERLRDLESRVGEGMTGRVSVPNLTGRTLASAASILNRSSVQLRLSTVLDVRGASVNAGTPANAERIVLMQMPGADDRVPSDALVRLVVTAPSETPRPAPTISGFDPEPVRVNEVLTIRGRNFPTAWTPQLNDRVTFDDVEGTVMASDSNTQALAVRVPEGIPGVPDEGDTETSVMVTVTVRGQAVSDEVDVQPSSGRGVPTISSIRNESGGEINPGSTILIEGDNFADAAGDNTIIYNNDITRTASEVVDGGIETVVPSAEDLGLRGSGGFVQVNVEVAGVRSEGFTIEILIPE